MQQSLGNGLDKKDDHERPKHQLIITSTMFGGCFRQEDLGILPETENRDPVDENQESEHQVPVVLVVLVIGDLRSICLNLGQFKDLGHLPDRNCH